MGNTLIKQAVAEALEAQKDAMKADLLKQVLEEVGKEKAVDGPTNGGSENPNAKGWVSASTMQKHYTPCADPADLGLRMAMGIRAFVMGGKDMRNVPKMIHDVMKDAATAKYYEKSIETQNISSGGAFTTDTLLFAETLPLLRAKSFLMQAGAQVIMADTDKVTIPGVSTGASSFWVGESKRIRVTDMKFNQIKLNAKKNAGLLVISNDWKREGANPGIDTIIRDDLIAAVNQGLHLGALWGDGSEYQPLGLDNDPRCGIVSVGALPTSNMLSKFLKAMMDANIDFNPLTNAHVMGSDLYIAYWNLQDNYGRYYYRDEMLRRTPQAPWGTIEGTPVFVYTEIKPSSASHKPTSLYTGQWNELKILMRKAVELTEYTEATIFDENGTGISGPQNDVTFLRVLALQDSRCRRAGALQRSSDIWTEA